MLIEKLIGGDDMNNRTRLTDILRDAISDYASNSSSKTPAEWLQGYLGEKLPEKSVDTIHNISSGIITALDVMEERKSALNEALEEGQSAESWLTDDIMAESGGNGSKARLAAEFFNGISASEKSYDETVDVDIIDVDAEDWNDSEWNDYKLKDSLKSIASSVGKAGLREIASETFLKSTEEGIGNALAENGIADALVDGANQGLKVAVSAGLAVAEESGIIPKTTLETIAAVAHKTVESFSIFRDVVKSKVTMTEAIIKIKNTAVSTFSGLWKQNKEKIKEEIVQTAGRVYGIVGATVSGAINGMLTPPQNGSRLVNAVKGAAKAAWNFLTKERHLPFFNKNKNKQKTYN